MRTEGRNRIYRTWHPSAEGYRLIAEGIGADLVRRHLPPGARADRESLSGARHAVRTAKKIALRAAMKNALLEHALCHPERSEDP